MAIYSRYETKLNPQKNNNIITYGYTINKYYYKKI